MPSWPEKPEKLLYHLAVFKANDIGGDDFRHAPDDDAVDVVREYAVPHRDAVEGRALEVDACLRAVPLVLRISSARSAGDADDA